jgi:hypothetical protein
LTTSLPLPASIRAEVERALAPAPFEITDLGVYGYRGGIEKAALRRAEEALARAGPVRVLDFCLGPEDLAENVVRDESGAVADYIGVARAGGHRVFRVDHHHDLRVLATESTTPLALRWLRALHAAGRGDILEAVARSRYVADHCDADILLSNHVARRNDYVLPPPAALEPAASRVFDACVGIEHEIRAGRVTFAAAQTEWLPALEGWVGGGPRIDPARATRLDALEAASRDRRAQALASIDAWDEGGRLETRAGGRLIFLDAPAKIENADLFVHVTARAATDARFARVVVQVLRFPKKGDRGHIFKVRSHGGFDLNPLIARLRERLPAAAFGGRSAAFGSQFPVAPEDAPDVLRLAEAAVEEAPPAPR